MLLLPCAAMPFSSIIDITFRLILIRHADAALHAMMLRAMPLCRYAPDASAYMKEARGVLIHMAHGALLIFSPLWPRC